MWQVLSTVSTLQMKGQVIRDSDSKTPTFKKMNFIFAEINTAQGV